MTSAHIPRGQRQLTPEGASASVGTTPDRRVASKSPAPCAIREGRLGPDLLRPAPRQCSLGLAEWEQASAHCSHSAVLARRRVAGGCERLRGLSASGPCVSQMLSAGAGRGEVEALAVAVLRAWDHVVVLSSAGVAEPVGHRAVG